MARGPDFTQVARRKAAPGEERPEHARKAARARSSKEAR